jgi:hypothetical protein
MPGTSPPAIVSGVTRDQLREDRTMEQIVMSTEDLEDRTKEEVLVHAWRSEQLRRLGLPRILAEAFADLVDWHALARLIERGCTPELALEIVR